MGYIKQFDAVRAVAVIFVIISHWYKHIPFIDNLSLGSIGVNTFFVLSGFLITSILLKQKINSEKTNWSNVSILKNFYIRRSLRIFPIYYLLIFTLFLIGNKLGADIGEAFFYLLTYTTNIYFYNKQAAETIIYHLWSLAVEEQFYLFWPWILLFINNKYLPAVIICLILISIISLPIMSTEADNFSDTLLFTCFDCFGAGALLAYIRIIKPQYLRTFYKWLLWAAISSFVLLALYILQIGSLLSARTLHAIIALWVITYIYINADKDEVNFKFILHNVTFQFLGKISYGLYLYHLAIPYITNAKFIRSHLYSHLPDSIKNYEYLLIEFENIVLLLTVSYLSFVFIESPFLRLKKYAEFKSSKASDAYLINIQ
ncbi:acyltransferase [Spirosoma sp. KNUC1025]|uniref:acyltransferase family protein n=1 Tax=Spirosoma sp. KNUC1025 TaxID=2894082 RepID=UPI00386B5C82|nr:acyltransferase [Spirosoma sp. KNUC1025]